MDVTETLARVELFAGLSTEDLRRIARLSLRRTVAAGTAILKQGEYGVGFYVIESGRVEITAKHDERIEQLAELGPGGYFGEIALLENQLRSATVTALENTTLIVLTRWDFLAELKDLTLQPGFAFSGGDQSTRPDRERPRLLRHRGWGEQ